MIPRLRATSPISSAEYLSEANAHQSLLFLPVSIFASMYGLYTLAIAVVPIFLWYAYSTVYRLRFKQYEDLPRAPPSLIWGHLATIGEFYKKGDSRRHIGVFTRDGF